jgi:CBS domain-containing protein
MKIKDVAKINGRPVITITPETTVRQAVQLLVDSNIGALPVVDKNGAVLGIVSERDLLQSCTLGSGMIDTIKVDTIMTKDVVIALVEDDIDYISSVMTQHGIRHMPVMAGPKLDNMISMRDIVNAELADLEVKVRFLNSYISGGMV